MKQITIALFLVFLTNSLTAQVFISNGEYIIISAQNEKVFDAAGGNKDNGTNICVWDFHGQENQKFIFEFADNGEFVINSKHSGKRIDVSQGSTQDLANLQLWEMNTSPAQKFRLEPVENTDMFMIVNVNSNKAITLDPNSGNVFQLSKPSPNDKQGGNLNQCWRIAQRLTFQNDGSKKKLDVQGGLKTAGAKLQIYDNNNSKAQAYDLIPVANSSDFYLRNINSLKYLTVTNNNNASGAVIEQNDFNITALQKFQTDKVSEYAYYIKPTGSSFVLGVQNNNNVNGTYVILADRQSTASQHWTFYNYDPKGTSQHVKEELKDAGKAVGNKVIETGGKAVEKTKEIGNTAKDKLKKLFK
jgi:hypothetical protein